MKNLVIAVSILLISSALLGQTSNDFSPLEGFVPKPNQIYLIGLTDGSILQGRVEYLPEKGRLMVKESSHSIANYPSERIATIEPLPFRTRGSLGIGIGMPFGGLGLNGELWVQRSLSITGGVGTLFNAGLGYSLGVKYHLRSPEKTWQPRLLAFWGTNGLISEFSGYDIQIMEKFRGINVGAGQVWMLGWKKKHGFELDLFYVLQSGVYEYARLNQLNAPGRMDFSFGYRFVF